MGLWLKQPDGTLVEVSGGSGGGGGDATQMLLSGTVTGMTNTAGATSWTFDPLFATAPDVVATSFNAVTSGDWTCKLFLVEPGQFQLIHFLDGVRQEQVEVTYQWHAFGTPADPADANAIGSGTAAPADSLVVQKKRITITEDGTFDKADYPGLIQIEAWVQGGGGGGGGCGVTVGAEAAAGSGGGGGGMANPGNLLAADLAASEPIVVGAGGIGGPDNTTGGTNGGNTTAFGATGSGGAGAASASSTAFVFANSLPGNGGSISGSGKSGLLGQQGNPPVVAGERNLGGRGGASYFGGAGTGANAITSTGSNGGDGLNGGGGGGGANRPNQATVRSGGDGGNGFVLIDVYQAVGAAAAADLYCAVSLAEQVIPNITNTSVVVDQVMGGDVSWLDGNQIMVPEAGTYEVGLYYEYVVVNGGTRCRGQIFTPGGDYNLDNFVGDQGGVGGVNNVAVTNLQAGEIVNWQVWHDHGADATTTKGRAWVKKM